MPLPKEILEQIPEEYRESETLERFNSLGDLAKSYLEQRSLVGQSIRIPTEEAGEEARQEFIDKLMRNAPELMIKPSPEEPEQNEEFYRTIGKPKDFSEYQNPEGAELNPEVESELREILHQASLTNSQYQKVVAAMAERDKAAQESFKQAKEEDKSSLQGKWGQTLEDRMKAAKKVNEEFYPGRDFDSLTSSEIEGLYRVSEAVTGNSTQAANQPKTGSDAVPPDEALRRANEIMNNPEYWDQGNPNQQYLIKQRLKYLEMAGGTQDMTAHQAKSFTG